MTLLERAKEAVRTHVVNACVTVITLLLAWITSIITPVLWPVVRTAIPPEALFPVLLLSLLINAILGVLLYFATRKEKPALQLRYGIYWDKDNNPFCPVCQKPVIYDDWDPQGWGYYCQPCSKITPLQDAHGKKLKPEQVLQ
jgi:hypothetical protein